MTHKVCRVLTHEQGQGDMYSVQCKAHTGGSEDGLQALMHHSFYLLQVVNSVRVATQARVARQLGLAAKECGASDETSAQQEKSCNTHRFYAALGERCRAWRQDYDVRQYDLKSMCL